MTPKQNRAPTLRLSVPDPKVADSGKVRYGDAAVTAGAPALSTPDPRVADGGKVRYGDAAITAGFPSHR
jgi:hypothetical protein